MELPSAGRTISFLPMTQGAASAKGIFSAIGGAILAVVGFVFEQPWLTALGVSVGLGGVSALIAPHPRALASSEKKDNQASYQFSGPVNTQQQGGCVPLLYGKMLCGSAVISAGLDAGDITPTPGTGSGGNSNNGGSGNPALPIGGLTYEP
ncbi:MAG: tail assembly protein [Verrucomicrobia bacterium]|nr:tail assembly protein [Verrucomicrobiota bacterium]